ncbi:hypothetical protein Tco_1058701 [Tanacetum coccineum]|uniref:Secreted protein n=1 Tax=Tanacetum coccineum TaxID=301880 RepID=A0ABQ5HA84_9ASTR
MLPLQPTLRLVIVLASALRYSVEAILVRLFAISEEYGQYRVVTDDLQTPSESNPSEEVSSVGYLIRGCFSIEPSAGMLLSGLADVSGP